MKNEEKVRENFRARLAKRFPGTTSSLLVLDGDDLLGFLEKHVIIATIMPTGELWVGGKSCAVYEYFLPHDYATAEDIQMVEEKIVKMWEIARA